jgi:hypothetical protein
MRSDTPVASRRSPAARNTPQRAASLGTVPKSVKTPCFEATVRSNAGVSELAINRTLGAVVIQASVAADAADVLGSLPASRQVSSSASASAL